MIEYIFFQFYSNKINYKKYFYYIIIRNIFFYKNKMGKLNEYNTNKI